MLKPIRATLLALMLSSATSLAAQETTETEAAPEDPGLSLGEEVEQEPRPLQVGEPYLASESGDFAIRCLKAEEGATDPCQLYQLLNDDQGNSVAEFTMFPIPNGSRAAAGATIVVPLETLLTEQLTISVDGANARRYPFTFCNAAGCVARVGFTAEEVASFKRGNVATLRMVPAAAPDQEVVLSLSLTGFTAGYDALGNSQ